MHEKKKVPFGMIRISAMMTRCGLIIIKITITETVGTHFGYVNGTQTVKPHIISQP